MSEKRKANGVEYYHDWERYGGIHMTNARTIDRYKELKNCHPNDEEYGVFFAFSDKQFEAGIEKIKPFIKDGEKIVSAGAGCYGTRSEIKRFSDFYEKRNKMLAAECNPQEVYFYEWDNHECMITHDDDKALKCVIDIFGKEVAHTIDRVYPNTPTNVLAPLTERDKHLGEYDYSLRMLGRLSFDCRGFFNPDDCRYHRPKELWGRNWRRQIEEMRRLYDGLPDDIKDESCVSKKVIEAYARRFSKWAEEEFAKPMYDEVEPTPKHIYDNMEIEMEESLWYKDDEGKWHHPTDIYFSSDLRCINQDCDETHGRAFTSYLGKNGKTITRVYRSDYVAITYAPFYRTDLCDVSCKYEYKPGHSRLFNFYHEEK